MSAITIFLKEACKLVAEGNKSDDVALIISKKNELLPDPLPDSEVETIIKSASKYNDESISPSDAKIIKNYVEKEIHYTTQKKDGSQESRNYMEYKSKLDYSPDMNEPEELFASFMDESGIRYLFEKKRPGYFIDHPDEFHTRLIRNRYCTDFTKGKELTMSRYMRYIKDICMGYNRFSCIMEIEPKDDTLYPGEEIKPKQTGYFRKLLSTMTFFSPKDEYRFAAGLLSSFLNSTYDGQKPLFAIVASASSSGKSNVVRSGVNIIQGMPIIEFQGLGKDDMQISGIRSLRNKNVLYDNLQYVKNDQMLNITTAVTDEYIPAWFMNMSHCRVKNNKTYWATFNTDNSFNTDILNRIVTIRLKDGRDTSPKRKAIISKLMTAFIIKREEVVADVLYYLSLYDRTKKVNVNRHIKFSKWSEVMASILSNIYPEINEFDFVTSVEDDELSQELTLMKDFLDELMEDADERFIANASMLEKYRVFYGDNRITTTRVNTTISNMAKSIKKYDLEKGSKKISGKTAKGWKIYKKDKSEVSDRIDDGVMNAVLEDLRKEKKE